MLLLIDNYDSFSHCIARYLEELGQQVTTVKNDEISLSEIDKIKPHYLVISPGPCSPNEAGISLDVINQFKGDIPILGVCLGHQAIVQAFGGQIIQAPLIMHAKTSTIEHKQAGMFKSMSSPFMATRYHSLIADPNSLPECLEITAWCEDAYFLNQQEIRSNSIMAIKHKSLPIEGVQFHPESVLSDQGHNLLNGFLEQYK